MATLSVSDSAAVAASLVALPYALGFAHLAAFFSGFGIALSEVDLAQSEYFVEAARIVLALPWGAIVALSASAAFVGAVVAGPEALAVAFRRMRAGTAFGGLATAAALLLAVLSAFGWGAATGATRASDYLHDRLPLPLSGLIDVDGGASVAEAVAGRALTRLATTRVLFDDGSTFFLLSRMAPDAAWTVIRVPHSDRLAHLSTLRAE